MAQSSHYTSFLLRLWRDDEHTPWRIQLEDPHTGARHGFASMERLVAFLDQQMGEALLEKAETNSLSESNPPA
ncbi:MAG: hypothetical protein HUU38_01585 [Anaerolineales bacterium]|nr:hypothetical protein [Anaerolineales bacterium]